MKDETEFATANTTKESSDTEKVKMSPDMVTQEYLHKARINRQGIKRYDEKITALGTKKPKCKSVEKRDKIQGMIDLDKKILAQFKQEYTEQLEIIKEWLNDDQIKTLMNREISVVTKDDVMRYIENGHVDCIFTKRIKEFFDIVHGRKN